MQQLYLKPELKLTQQPNPERLLVRELMLWLVPEPAPVLII